MVTSLDLCLRVASLQQDVDSDVLGVVLASSISLPGG